jgi:hypothetical protein
MNGALLGVAIPAFIVPDNHSRQLRKTIDLCPHVNREGEEECGEEQAGEE